ncbi:MAG: hypothetical protein WCF84_21710 [Anaerolineae bacterium]
MMNKVESLEILAKFDRLAKRPGIIIITVVDDNRYKDWRTKRQATTIRFAQYQPYINYLWQLPDFLCERFFGNVREVDSDEFKIFKYHLCYQGRGRFQMIDEMWGTAEHVKKSEGLSLNRNGAFEVRLETLREWYKYARIEMVLQNNGWAHIFPDKQDPTCCTLDVFDPDKRDQIKQGIYKLLDLLMERAQADPQTTATQVRELATERCGASFTSMNILEIVERLIALLQNNGLVRTTSEQIDLSGFIPKV